MAEKKDWYAGANELLYKIKNTTSIDTFRLTRVCHIYAWVDSLIELCDDYKKCQNSITKNLIEKRMKEIVSELRHYKIFDDRFEEVFDEGR